jgi:hypothetical protein
MMSLDKAMLSIWMAMGTNKREATMPEDYEEEIEEAEEEDYPSLTVTFKPNLTECTMHRWAEITMRRVEKGLRAITRERNRLRRTALREHRKKEDA